MRWGTVAGRHVAHRCICMGLRLHRLCGLSRADVVAAPCDGILKNTTDKTKRPAHLDADRFLYPRLQRLRQRFAAGMRIAVFAWGNDLFHQIVVPCAADFDVRGRT